MKEGARETSALKPKKRSRGSTRLVDPGEIERLVRLMEETGLLEIEIQNGRGKLKLVRENHHLEAPRPQQAQAPAEAEGRASTASAAGAIAVTAPMVGTFHRALEPGGEPLVKVGEVVSPGEVLGVIEAMKMMNEIEAEFGGCIKQVLVEDGKPVEYGQPLFLIEPLSG